MKREFKISNLVLISKLLPADEILRLGKSRVVYYKVKCKSQSLEHSLQSVTVPDFLECEKASEEWLEFEQTILPKGKL